MIAYFLFAYLFYGSLMTGIGAMTNNMREAQQFAVWFSFLNFAPMIAMTLILSRPGRAARDRAVDVPADRRDRDDAEDDGAVLRGAGVADRVVARAAAGRGMARAQVLGARVPDRLLMYGKTPTLPEIMRWAGQK